MIAIYLFVSLMMCCFFGGMCFEYHNSPSARKIIYVDLFAIPVLGFSWPLIIIYWIMSLIFNLLDIMQP